MVRSDKKFAARVTFDAAVPRDRQTQLLARVKAGELPALTGALARHDRNNPSAQVDVAVRRYDPNQSMFEVDVTIRPSYERNYRPEHWGYEVRLEPRKAPRIEVLLTGSKLLLTPE